jgi:hypothetical protein
MRQLFTRLLSNWFAREYNRRIESALALHLRGEARTDGLALKRAHSRLAVQWSARHIHPWDSGSVSAEERAALFVKQALADADAALSRVFSLLPQLDSIELRVFHPDSDHTIMNGVVSRASFATHRPLSNRMWLSQLGVQFRLNGDRFEPLEFRRDDLSETA